MNKKELVKAIAEKTKLPQKEVKAVIDAFVDVVIDALKKEEEVRLTGFGTFTLRERKERVYVNPKTGEPIEVPKRRVPVFRVGSRLKEVTVVEKKKKRSSRRKKKK